MIAAASNRTLLPVAVIVASLVMRAFAKGSDLTAAAPEATIAETGSTTPPPTTPPPATAASPIAPLAEDDGIVVWRAYVGAALAGDYETAWVDLTPADQAMTTGYDGFVKYWKTIAEVSLRSCSVTSVSATGPTLRLHVSYVKQNGTKINEIEEIRLVQVMDTGAVLIDGYRFVSQG